MAVLQVKSKDSTLGAGSLPHGQGLVKTLSQDLRMLYWVHTGAGNCKNLVCVLDSVRREEALSRSLFLGSESRLRETR